MGRFLIYFQYIGTRYRGVVRASGFSSTSEERFIGVQDVLEEALEELRPVAPVKMHVSSRTDTGVHALCNTAHFDMLFKSRRTSEPREIAPQSITSALNKKLQNEDVRLDIQSMEDASRRLVGTHDFSAFRSASVDDHKKSPIKTMDTINLSRTHGFLNHHCNKTGQLEFWELTFHSKSFLYRQIRRMTGALVAVGLGRLSPSDITTMLESCDNSHMHGTTLAPPYGLYLKEVCYNENDLIFDDSSSLADDTSVT